MVPTVLGTTGRRLEAVCFSTGIMHAQRYLDREQQLAVARSTAAGGTAIARICTLPFEQQ